MKVRMLTGIAGANYSYHPKSGPNEDGVVDVDDKLGKSFVEAGIAEIPRETAKKPSTTTRKPKTEKTAG